MFHVGWLPQDQAYVQGLTDSDLEDDLFIDIMRVRLQITTSSQSAFSLLLILLVSLQGEAKTVDKEVRYRALKQRLAEAVKQRVKAIGRDADLRHKIAKRMEKNIALKAGSSR
ncbi:hypothetical protein NE237_019600 [Protea cynaroides]|uniref:Uncharacterized protein n=1 Tax=Protea cynaroides TaxID=273540 RepID=A0A9Q0K2N8_9MAGN|nr:hypothetical protein NE237_019600 [Protea cynaroides]